MSVHAITTFEVKTGREDAFEAGWREVVEVFSSLPGFMNSKLHRAVVNANRFLNYSQWSTVEAFNDALADSRFQEIMKSLMDTLNGPPYGQVFKTVYEKATG